MTQYSWNEIVSGHNNPHFLQTTQWAEVKSHSGWKAHYLLWHTVKNELKLIVSETGQFPYRNPAAAALLLERQVLPGISLLYSPKGPLLADWTNRFHREQIFSDLEHFTEIANAMQLKIDPDLELGRGVPGEEGSIDYALGQEILEELGQRGWQFSQEQIQFRNSVLVDVMKDEDQILARMKSKTRYNIRLSSRKGITIREGNEKDLTDLYHMYAKTSVRGDFTIRSENYYQNLWRTFLGKNSKSKVDPIAQPMIAEFEGHPVAGAVIFCFGDRAWYLHGMSLPEHSEKMAPHLIQWEAIRWAKTQGCKVYDMWGAPDVFVEFGLDVGGLSFQKRLWGRSCPDSRRMGLCCQTFPLSLIFKLGPQILKGYALVWKSQNQEDQHRRRRIILSVEGGGMFPKISFAHLPTPIEKLPHLSKLLGGPELFIKRDDQTGLAFGGNKTRKLEYLMAAAVGNQADLVLSTGAAQSNHCRQTAAAAARSGLDCILVLVGPEPEFPTANLFLDKLLGAKIIWTDKNNRNKALQQACETAKEAGKKPYLIPYGGSNALGAYAYFQAYREIQDQMKNEMPDWIVFASSSGGTQAGLVSGANQDSGIKIYGISVDETENQLKENVLSIVRDLESRLGKNQGIEEKDILVNAGYTADGYGILNENDREAIHLFAKNEGILLDPVYTGRAGAGLIDLIRKGFFKKGERVLFWHTGGTPGLFADRYLHDL